MLMGSLFLADGQVMVALSGVSRIERRDNLLLVVADGGEVRLDASGYSSREDVQDIVSSCVVQAVNPVSDVEYVSGIDPVGHLPDRTRPHGE